MTRCKDCSSYAINHNSHGRDGGDGDLCDVCYWRKRAQAAQPSDLDVKVNLCEQCGKVLPSTGTHGHNCDAVYRPTQPQPVQPSQAPREHDFKNFHAQLCARFGYEHDPIDWKRDQVSLIEHIAKLSAAQPSQARELDYDQKAEIVSNWFSDEDMQSRAMQMLGDIERARAAINAKEQP